MALDPDAAIRAKMNAGVLSREPQPPDYMSGGSAERCDAATSGSLLATWNTGCGSRATVSSDSTAAVTGPGLMHASQVNTLGRTTYHPAVHRVGHQPQDRQSPRPHDPAVAAAAGGSGHRLTLPSVVLLVFGDAKGTPTGFGGFLVQ